MDRRTFIRRAGALAGGAAAGGAVAPAIAEGPEIAWTLTSSYPKALSNLYQVAEDLAGWVAAATDGRFRIRVAPVGEVAGPFGGLDAIRDGKAEMAHTASYYYTGEDPAFAFGTTVPFGLNARQQNAWLYEGGGNALLAELFAAHGAYGLPAGNTGAQMGGWFRKEINSVDDLKGLRMRIPGLGGATLARLGVEPLQMGGAEAAAKLAAGEIDAAEWVAPFDDLALGFHKSAQYYYHPGWWDGCGTVHLFIGLDKWNALPESYRAVLSGAAARANAVMQARYDTTAPAALETLVAEGAQLRTFPEPVLEACFAAAGEVFAEMSAASPRFKAIYDAWAQFRADQVAWFAVTESSFSALMTRLGRAGRL